MRVVPFLVLAILSFSALPFASAQSLADVAKKEKERRSTDTKKDGDEVIDEYTLAGFKDVKTSASKKSSEAEPELGEQSSELENDDKRTPNSTTKKDDLEAKAKRACAQKPDGIVCASLKERIQKGKARNQS